MKSYKIISITISVEDYDTSNEAVLPLKEVPVTAPLRDINISNNSIMPSKDLLIKKCDEYDSWLQKLIDSTVGTKR
tara:strand:- start:287 stop:514 length:228 start_codon:yes stop_codon:yes gene_type:complete